MPEPSPTFHTRMLAESVRALEREGRDPVADDVEATLIGRETDGGVEEKIVARAVATSAAGELSRSLRRYETSAAWLASAFLVVMALLGAGAARASLGVGADSRVNFFLALGTLLGVQTIMLLIWLLLMIGRPNAMTSMSLGGFVRWVVDVIMRRASRSPAQLAAIEGATVVHGSPRIARWTLSALSHAGWMAFNVGCLAALLVLLSTRHYTFVWETTILSERVYSPMVEALSTGPKLLGFTVPSEAQVTASQRTGESTGTLTQREATSQAWAGLLVGSIVVYGAIPRLVLLGLCIWRMGAARRAYRLDLNRTGFALLASRLSPAQRSLGVIDPDDGEGVSGQLRADQTAPQARPIGPPAIVGIEMDSPRNWPPRLDGVTLHDMGILNDRPDRQRAIHELHTAAQEPAALVIACALPATPDRGVGSIISQLRSAVRRPAIVLLTGGQALRERTDAAALGRRIEDWRRLAGEAGIQADHIIELDLDHATHASLSKLAAMLKSPDAEVALVDGQRATAKRGIERAFALILEHAAQWRDAPGHREQAALQREILQVYGSEPAKWSSLLASPKSISELSTDAAKTLRTNADRALSLLPPNLRVRPKWAIAGASAGAIGCIAAAMIAAPAAIGALPLWTAIGGAIAAAAGAALPGRNEDDIEREQDDDAAANAVRAASLWTLLLELQGRDEQAISRVLDKTLGDPRIDEPDQLESTEHIRNWLELVRHQFDLALAEESSS